MNDVPHIPKMSLSFLKKITTYLRTCLPEFPGKQHLHKNLFRLTWKKLGSYTWGFTVTHIQKYSFFLFLAALFGDLLFSGKQ